MKPDPAERLAAALGRINAERERDQRHFGYMAKRTSPASRVRKALRACGLKLVKR